MWRTPQFLLMQASSLDLTVNLRVAQLSSREPSASARVAPRNGFGFSSPRESHSYSMWLLGFIAFHVTSGVIHILLLLAVVSVIAHFFRGRAAV
jgi:hypothetical protein